VDLLYERGHPNGAYTEAIEIAFLDLLEHPREVSTLETAQYRTVLCPTVGVIVAGVAIVKPIDEQEVDGRAVPERRWVSGRFHR
jgi:hypothetical protein